MTEKKKNLSEFTPFEFSSAHKMKIGIVVSEWNDRITDSLFKGAKEALLQHGVLEENILVKYVPGSFELPLGAQWMLKESFVDAVICIGCGDDVIGVDLIAVLKEYA